MKKAVALLLVMLAFLLTACGKTPSQKAQEKAVEVCESFLNFDITKEEAKDKLDSIADTISSEDVVLASEIDYLSYLLVYPHFDREDFESRLETIKNRK